MRKLAQLTMAAGASVVLALGLTGSASASAWTSTPYADAGFMSYGDDIWVDHRASGGNSIVWWSTDYGRTGSCSSSGGEKWCYYDMRETGTITIQLCSYPPSYPQGWCDLEQVSTIGNEAG
ncbi:hypothetical protein GCM10015535_51580 [Streptomyces gelaticus]|uniref:Secreted protein n=1 Tax=Streptomyces gelaticus TaxID=285446 RepID=A0ABQ2W7P7_9ACTN|nr:hypothetical protein [Streptomyces gelaticus]GGV91918.1 hypothetical protein GCM10015535_51580 [Streptomyces gelaticus]